jgi:4a-hydroxytetrahydrobiopterin dehydratase
MEDGMALLTASQIARSLNGLHGWKRDGNAIRKQFRKRDFVHAMAFVNAVALIAQRADHHPDIDIRWNRVTLTLSTHSAGGLTHKDFDLARAIDAL